MSGEAYHWRTHAEMRFHSLTVQVDINVLAQDFRCMIMGGSYEPTFASRTMPKTKCPKNASGQEKARCYGGEVLDCQEFAGVQKGVGQYAEQA